MDSDKGLRIAKEKKKEEKQRAKEEKEKSRVSKQNKVRKKGRNLCL